MIIGTAGHIDHGKTSLVRALTGVDTDRLPEEKRRGISIELGYAYLHAPEGVSLGFVDVPGHERLLHTMLAGATGIEHALLVVAADDGVMPQTREHLAVVALLGVRGATVAITKIDRIDPAQRAARLAEVGAEVEALLAPTPLAGAPLFAVSAVTGEGIEALRARLVAVARDERAREHGLAFRLAVDRAFTLAGVGTVVTGTAFSGEVRVGDELRIAPGDRAVRVRGIHAQNRQAEHAQAGQRCALALAGVARDEVHRGEWICTPSIALATDRIDIELSLWPGEAKALRSGTTVHAHLGASDTMASLALLDRELLQPGETALAQLVLREKIAAWHGDRGVLRDASATRTMAGARVLDPFAPVRYRRTPERLDTLAAWRLDARDERIAALLRHAPLGLDTAQVARALSLADEAALPLPGDAQRIAGTAIAREQLDALEARIVARLDDFHRDAPDEVGPDARRLKRLAGPRTGDTLWRHAVESLVARGALVRSGTWLHRPDHAARLGEAEQKLAQKLLPKLADGGFDPPWVRDLAKDCGASEAVVRQTLASLARRGEAFQVVKDLYYPQATVERLAAIARDCLQGPEGLQAASFRDATGLGRKRAIQLLEFFDRVGFTRRVKDTHLLRPDTVLFEARP
ncbi:selenocysteine-specific elongation factor [Variovorax paradoxus]|jgi:selenocysteine-specific elongation factor|uniref:selenocysteine-specific translation elongation factor n=1 Tax=Variovorax paradoxus TaxID=34073 RepID=UPI0006E59FAD|nr:selenocysteine-specific elongation factor [Variovorax paradoxus]KPU99995.1 selenocysteine-specific elongation factor [Variovorax paradoxus]KPV10278.1 selenocysteine-specific elongation factor [Variovorax paradoxus]KPV18932.1 selenocysteine-specific elongation factor [Variovorax paradoxus]KPV30615.1 selenocysteine-specific elongation factor [Variovorax paradoxus]